MGEFQVAQRTSDGMFNATILLKQWNEHAGQKKVIAHYFENDSSNEFVRTIESKENFTHRNSVYVKSRASRGVNAGTWMHPLLFIDFAMWINPSFKYDVLKFVYDELIKYRNEAGDAYIELSAAIAKIVPKKELVVAISKVAQAINFVSFNEHKTMIRNTKDVDGMIELVRIERQIATLINDGFIKDFNSLINYLRKKWNDKYSPAVLAYKP